jgi:histidyl-tRNA synthetase
MSEAPLLRDELCDECESHYRSVKQHLDVLGIRYEEDFSLVRGLDYYTRTVFEIQSSAIDAAQNAIGGGGRYDRLMQEFGGPATPGLGFALGFERTLLAMRAAGAEPETPPTAQVFVARVDAAVSADVFRILSSLRDAGVAADADHQARSLKSQFKQADRLGARYVVVVGPDELAADSVTLRDMSSAEETRVPLGELAATLLVKLGG